MYYFYAEEIKPHQ